MRTEPSLEKKMEILKEWHLHLEHGSKENMKFNILKQWKWETIYKDVDKLVDNCKICKKAGGPIHNTRNEITESKTPNELWEVDLVGYLPLTKGNNRYILIAIDHYSKWLETKALTSKSKEEVA